jgi:hypothetical protein
VAALVPLLTEMAVNATFVAGAVFGARVVHFYYKFLKRGL